MKVSQFSVKQPTRKQNTNPEKTPSHYDETGGLEGRSSYFNPFTPKSDQVQIFPAASPEISHRTVWTTWLFIPYSDRKMIIITILITSLVRFSL